jgi:hypothetical protein
MKPLINKYFVSAHARRAGTWASVVADISVCFIRAPGSIVVGHDRAADDTLGL